MTRAGRFVVRHVPWNHPDADALREQLGQEVGPRYAGRDANLPPEALGFNAVDPDTVHTTIVVYTVDDEPIGHAALRWNAGELELKRMFVAAEHRGTGVAQTLLEAVEGAARDAGARRLILQTGDRQPDAVRLYEKQGYQRIPIFPPYEALTFSNCFAKEL